MKARLSTRSNDPWSVKVLLVLIFVLLTVYAPAELTRLVLDWNPAIQPWQWMRIMELCWIWIGYLAALGLFIVLTYRTSILTYLGRLHKNKGGDAN